jgi:hypothetical protein
MNILLVVPTAVPFGDVIRNRECSAPHLAGQGVFFHRWNSSRAHSSRGHGHCRDRGYSKPRVQRAASGWPRRIFPQVEAALGECMSACGIPERPCTAQNHQVENVPLPLPLTTHHSPTPVEDRPIVPRVEASPDSGAAAPSSPKPQAPRPPPHESAPGCGPCRKLPAHPPGVFRWR